MLESHVVQGGLASGFQETQAGRRGRQGAAALDQLGTLEFQRLRQQLSNRARLGDEFIDLTSFLGRKLPPAQSCQRRQGRRRTNSFVLKRSEVGERGSSSIRPLDAICSFKSR